MSQPYVGEIRMFGGNFAPAGWMLCQGQLLAISQNATLFNLIGTTYGGDGVNTFALPDLRGRAPIHQGQSPGTSSYTIGQNGGVETVTLTTNQLPSHTHSIVADSNNATTGDPTNAYYASSSPTDAFTVPGSAANPAAPMLKTFNAAVLPSQGGSQPHDNMQPFLIVNYIISLFGVFPSQN
jgi:microcystin-dependent protein